jgi:hypothetical protein
VKFEEATKKTPARLKGEIWLNVEQVLEKSPELWEEIQNNKNIEVSTGLYTNDIFNPGEHSNSQGKKTKYDHIATNYIPDHLAVLPGGVGACNWGDGCGIRANASENPASSFDPKSLLQAFEKFCVNMGIVAPDNNELSFSEIEMALRGAVMASRSFSPDEWIFIKDLYADRFIYGVEQKGEMMFFEQPYEIDENDEVVLVGTPIEGEVKQKFEPKQNNNNQKGVIMKEKLVQAIIANAENSYTDEDKDTLLKLHEDVLKGIAGDDCPCNNSEEEGAGEEESAGEPNTNSKTSKSDMDENEGHTTDKMKKKEEMKMKKNSEEGEQMVHLSLNELNELFDKRIEANNAKNAKEGLVSELKANGVELTEEEVSALSVNTLETMLTKAKPQGHSPVAHFPTGNMGNNNDSESAPKCPDLVTLMQENA